MIRVTEKLPPRTKSVLALVGCGRKAHWLILQYWTKGTGHDGEDGWFDVHKGDMDPVDDVTYWTPLPAMPAVPNVGIQRASPASGEAPLE